ncbi:MAG TPA: RNA polymerase subunit sigma-24, partial [Actinopolymorphaceae bacterium]
AAATGKVEELLELLAPDVELHSDGGGLRKAPFRAIVGADKVGRFLAAITQQPPPEPTAYLAPVNDGVALVVLSEGRVDSVFWMEVEAPAGGAPRILAMHLLANPEKLGALADITRVGTPIPLRPPTD